MPELSQGPDLDFTDANAVGRLVVRARRLADLSQRDLAARVGASPATIARLETGDGLPSVHLLSAILHKTGLRMRVVDAVGNAVVPVPKTVVRDNAGRRFPAHLDVDPPDLTPLEVVSNPRYDRPPAHGWFHHRAERDRLAARNPDPPRQPDHPTVEQLELREQLRRRRQPVIAPDSSMDECTCPDECYDDDVTVGCTADCTCQCEPARWSGTGS